MKFLIGLIVVMYSQFTFAECRGSWGISTQNVHSNDIESTPKIRVEIELSDALRKCGLKGFLLKTEENGQIRFKQKQSSMLANVTDEQGRAYNALKNKQIFIPIIGNSARQSFQLWFADDGHHRPGIYSANLTLALFDVKRSAKKRKASVQIYPYLSINLYSPSIKNNTLDFGVLTSGSRKRVELGVYSNTSYSIEVESKNGALIHSQNEGEVIRYSVSLDGKPIHFGSAIPFSPPSASGHRKEMEFRVGSVEGAIAGRYKDTVTITATARP
ncbi:hypothetical protein VHA01S_016_00100 [Vibrio halioticoli NBRC 102217]|uniref:Spore coat protein U domain-containing protein n=1 Tax=Vibrio halioticoli NBRC 102217 TaxID=1219072 RepID=V5FCH1_9VIBR|nr:hypothetical protein [Vibrio halioticoli]GAD89153.1 hypothetical protein VHA01S_016_00100 [Vibrio halioticoli NBRC 102217]